MNKETEKSSLKDWFIAIVITLVVFYLMDQGIMAMQGLPLSFDMSPAQ